MLILVNRHPVHGDSKRPHLPHRRHRRRRLSHVPAPGRPNPPRVLRRGLTPSRTNRAAAYRHSSRPLPGAIGRRSRCAPRPVPQRGHEQIRRRRVLGRLINQYEPSPENRRSKPMAEFWSPTGLQHARTGMDGRALPVRAPRRRPHAPPDWGASAAMTTVGVAFAIIGVGGYQHRDLAV